MELADLQKAGYFNIKISAVLEANTGLPVMEAAYLSYQMKYGETYLQRTSLTDTSLQRTLLRNG